MNKSNFWIWSLVILVCLGVGAWLLGFWLGGCGTASRPDLTTTTTSVSGGTTTTSGPAGGISGKVTWNWSGYSAADQTGTLMVFLWTDEDFTNGDLIATQGLSPAYQKFTLIQGQTSASYNFSSPGGPLKGSATATSSTYYLFAILYIGRSVSVVGGKFPDAQTGDKIGQFSDGKLPLCFGGSTHAQAITYNGTSQPNKNFALNGTWTTSTTTTTMPPSAFWQNIGNVTRNGSAENARVDALVCDNSGNLYVGGYFDSIGGKPANNIAKWNHSTSSWESLLGGLGSEVNALALYSGNLYAAEINKVKKWNGTSWSSLGSGFTGTMVVLLALAVDQSGNVYAGGSFDYADGVPANNVAKWKTTLSTWDAMAGGLRQTGWSNPTGQVFDMTAGSDGNIYFCGSINTTESIPINGIAKWKVASSSWEALPAGGGGLAVAADNSGNIYTQPAKWNGSTWQSLTDSDALRPPTNAMAARSASEVFMGSDGYGAPVETAGAVAKLNSTTWNNLAGELINSAGYANVRALAIDPSGDLYVGGEFTSAGGTPAANLVKRLNP